MGSGFFSINSHDTLLDRVLCSGSESALNHCNHTLFGGLCSHDAAVVCQGTCMFILAVQNTAESIIVLT